MNDAATPLYRSLMEAMRARYSCRAYDPELIPSPETVDLLLEAARTAPSACNRKPYRFIVLNGDEAHELMSRAYPRPWAQTAPTYIVAVALTADAWTRAHDGKNHADIDVAIAVEHICLAAAALGLGSCWVCNFVPGVMDEALNLAADEEIVAILPIGYPAPDATR